MFDDQDRPIDVLYLEVNPAVKRITGLDLAGRSLREIDPNYESHWWETFGRVAQTGIGERQELYAEPLKSWFNFYAFKVGDADSYRVTAAFQDVTERKNLEQERDRFLAVGSDLQVIIGNDGYFRWVSPTFERLLGWTPAEMTAPGVTLCIPTMCLTQSQKQAVSSLALTPLGLKTGIGTKTALTAGSFGTLNPTWQKA